MPVISGRIIVSHQSAKTSTSQQQSTGTTGTMAPQQQSALVQIPSAFIRVRQQPRVLTVTECPRCQKLVASPNAVFCAACGLPLYGAPCPSCSQILEYSREHLKPNSEISYCCHCGVELEWRQRRGGPVYLELY